MSPTCVLDEMRRTVHMRKCVRCERVRVYSVGGCSAQLSRVARCPCHLRRMQGQVQEIRGKSVTVE
jgi:hypothetical protein